MLIKEMLIKLPENINDLYFCGDIHGNLDYLKYFINTGVGFPQKIFNSCIVLCGDVGLGFSPDLESMKIKVMITFDELFYKIIELNIRSHVDSLRVRKVFVIIPNTREGPSFCPFDLLSVKDGCDALDIPASF